MATGRHRTIEAEFEFDAQQDQNVMEIPNNSLEVVVRNSIIKRHFD